MSKIIIDGKEIDVPAEYTVLQACEEAGAEVPRFCFHERVECARFAPGPEWRAAGCVHNIADGEKSARRRDGISAHQSSA